MVLNYPVDNFKVYINDRDILLSQLPPLAVKSGYNAKWDLQNSYSQSITGTWIASCLWR